MAILAQALLQDAETLYTVPTGKTASFFVNINNSLTTPYIFSSASYDSVSFDVSSEGTNLYSLAFNDDGTKFYVLGVTNDTIFQYSLATAYDMSTASYDSVSFDVSSEDTTPYSLAFNSDGTKFYVLGYANDTIFQYSLGEPVETAVSLYLRTSAASGDYESKENVFTSSLEPYETLTSASFVLGEGEKVAAKSSDSSIGLTICGIEETI